MPINWRNGSPFCDSRGAAVSGRVTMPPVQRLGWPERHCGQLPQKPERQATTWSPGLTVVTSAPTASTTPAPSWPSTIGRSSGKRPIPSTTCRSLWHTPVATVRTSTSRPHGLSTSTCSIVSGACTLRKTAALISIGLSPHRIDLAATACDEPDRDHRDECPPDPLCRNRGRRRGAHQNRGGLGKVLLGGGSLARRGLCDAGEHRCGIALEDLLARFLADLSFGKRLPGPVAAELGAVGAAHDALGAVQPDGRLDRVRAERVAVHIHPRLPDARRRQLLLRRVEQAAMVHALDLVGKVTAQIVDADRRVGVVGEE